MNIVGYHRIYINAVVTPAANDPSFLSRCNVKEAIAGMDKVSALVIECRCFVLGELNVTPPPRSPALRYHRIYINAVVNC